MSQIVDAVDLVVLVADKDLEEAVEALLARTGDLQLRPFRFEVRRHPNRDGGCRTGAANFLRPFLQRYRRSLVLFDRDGCGSSRSRTEIQREVDADLARNGWADRTKAIVIEPELEAWVWGDLAQASRTLGWGEDAAGLRRCLRARDLWEPRRPKPSDPKKAMRAAMECAPPGRRRKAFGEDIWRDCRLDARGVLPGSRLPRPQEGPSNLVSGGADLIAGPIVFGGGGVVRAPGLPGSRADQAA